MTEALRDLLAKIIQEEELLNRRYTELADYLDQPHLAIQFRDFQDQGWKRIKELHNMWKGLQEFKS